MKKTLIVIVVLLLGIGSAVLPAASLSPFSASWALVSAEEVVVTLDEMDDGTPVDLRGDQTLVIDLEGNLSTGYQWQVAAADDAILKQVGQFEFRQYADVAGSAGRQILRFRAVGEGQTDLALVYRRPWEDAAPARNYAVRVRAAGPFAPYKDADTAAEPPAARDLGPIGATALPTSFEWCSLGGCTPVKNQGICGSCWAFATAGVVESLIKLSDGVTRDLAEQYLVSCNIDGWDCDGGSRAFDYFIDRFTPAELAAGAVYESDYPYTSGATGNTGTCTGSPHDKYEELVSWGYVAGGIQYPTVAQIQQAIYDYGPVYVSVCAGAQFQAYHGGVFSTDESSACGGGTNHGVVLVGWDDGQGVWYLRNSWSPSWGESLAGAGGYMRIAYGTSNVGRWPAYAVYEPTSNVSIEKAVVDSHVDPGDPVTFTLSIANSGEALAAGVVVTDLIPAEVLTPTVDSTLAITPTGVVSYVWNVEPLSTGESGTITISGWIDPSLPSDFSFTNWASISDPDDHSPANNTSSVFVGGSVVYLPLVAYSEASPSPGGWVTIVSEDFEGGTFPGSSWQVFDGNSESGLYYWGRRSCRASDGSYSGWSVGAGDTTWSCGSDYRPDVYAWMIYGPFSLADASAAELSFDWWSETEVDWDTFFWGASADGSSFSGYSVSGGWAYWTEGEVLDLGGLAGDDSVWIAFGFKSDYNINYEGSFVDNIVLRKYVDGAAPSDGGDSAALLPKPGPGRTIEFTTIRLER
ncbi:MAG: C1 family peptidase [Anaerolineae bacterium]